MAGRMDGESRHRADLVGVAIFEQPVELAAVALKIGAFIEDLAEYLLHDSDLLTDPDLAAELVLNVRSSRQMIGMHMGFRSAIPASGRFE